MRDLRWRRIDVAARTTAKCGTSPEFPGYGLDAQCRDHNHCAGFAVQCRSFSGPFDERRADTLRAHAGTYAHTQEDELHWRVLQLETTLPSTPVSSAWLGDGQRRQAIQGRNSMHGCCKAANHVASGESVLCLLLGNRLASDGHAHQRQGERCSTRPFTIRLTVTAGSMICPGARAAS